MCFRLCVCVFQADTSEVKHSRSSHYAHVRHTLHAHTHTNTHTQAPLQQQQQQTPKTTPSKRLSVSKIAKRGDADGQQQQTLTPIPQALTATPQPFFAGTPDLLNTTPAPQPLTTNTITPAQHQELNTPDLLSSPPSNAVMNAGRAAVTTEQGVLPQQSASQQQNGSQEKQPLGTLSQVRKAFEICVCVRVCRVNEPRSIGSRDELHGSTEADLSSCFLPVSLSIISS